MKKQSRIMLFLWMFVVVIVGGGIFLLIEHHAPAAATDAGVSGSVSPATQPDADIQQSDDASTTIVATVAMQTFSNDGYSFDVPASWNIERTGTDTIALHTDVSSTNAACKIEVSAFPFASGVDVADWIGHRIGADPSLAVVERSSENISFASGTGVEWIGTIDGMPTTLVYAFNGQHAYEIAPSVISEGAGGSAQCDDMLGTFLSALKI